MLAKSMLAGFIALDGISFPVAGSIVGDRNMSAQRGGPVGDYYFRLGGPALPAVADPNSPWQRSPGNIRPSVVLMGPPGPQHTSYSLVLFPGDQTLFQLFTFAGASGAPPVLANMVRIWFSIEFLLA